MLLPGPHLISASATCQRFVWWVFLAFYLSCLVSHSCPPRCWCFLSLPINSETNCPLLLKPKYCTLSTRQVLATCLRHFHFLLTSVKRSRSATTTKHPCNQTTRSSIKETFSLFSFNNQMFSCAPGIWEQTALMFLEHSYVKSRCSREQLHFMHRCC